MASQSTINDNNMASEGKLVEDQPTASVPIASQLNLERVQWSDFDTDEEGRATGVFGMLFSEYSSKQLRSLCSRLNLKGCKNVKKQDMVDKLILAFNLYKNYKGLEATTGGSAPRKQVQCSFRLMNILFHDDFAAEFATLGDAATRLQLDKGTAGNDEHFWVKVQTAFVSNEQEDYDQFLFLDDEVFAANDIDPGIIVPHDWKKLRSIWKAVNADYKAALTRYTISGTHDSNFYSFCNGKLDTYYLRKLLQERPELNETVEADLPTECALSSEEPVTKSTPMSDGANSSGNGNSSKNGNSTKRKRGENDIALAIRDFGNSQMRAELAKHKLQIMQKEDNRREVEHKQLEHKLLFEEWEKLQMNIRLLRQDMRDANNDESTKAELQDDINGLVRRKNDLAFKLGLK